MSDFTLTPIRLFEGVWEGYLARKTAGDVAPAVRVSHLDQPLDAVRMAEAPDGQGWVLSVDVTPQMLSDGVQTVLVEDAATALLSLIGKGDEP